MIRAINCILIILILLLTALFGLIALFIFATEQPENLQEISSLRNETIFKLYKQTKTTGVPVKTTTLMEASTSPPTFKSTLKSTTELMISNETTPIISSTSIPLIEDETDTENSTQTLVPLPTKLKLANAEKVMSIGMFDNNTFYAAKVNGEIEFFNWTTFELQKTEHINVPIHRIGFLSDKRLVVTETKALHLFDQDFRVIVELKLGYQALDLQIFDDLIYVLSRLDGTIFVFDSNLVQKFKITWTRQNSCNFIQPTNGFVYVSCDSAVVKLSNEGKLVGQTNVTEALYSLAIYHSESRQEIWAVQRGREELHVYNEDLKLKYTLKTENRENAVWSTIGLNDERVYALDYVSNTIRFFTIIQ